MKKLYILLTFLLLSLNIYGQQLENQIIPTNYYNVEKFLHSPERNEIQNILKPSNEDVVKSVDYMMTQSSTKDYLKYVYKRVVLYQFLIMIISTLFFWLCFQMNKFCKNEENNNSDREITILFKWCLFCITIFILLLGMFTNEHVKNKISQSPRTYLIEKINQSINYCYSN